MANLEQLFRDYNHYRFHTNHYQKLVAAGKMQAASLKPLKQRLDALSKMAGFCAEHGIDPRHWLYTLFQTKRWLFAPRFDQLTPKAHLERYSNLQHSPNSLYATKIRTEWQQDRGDRGASYDARRDMSATTEAYKRNYLEINPEVCLDNIDKTLGYHPKSLVCARCPIRQRCESQLSAAQGYDVSKLRRGEMSLNEAQMLESRRYGN